ncbi:MAG TPA: hypothetical protein VHZ98_11635 [Galbitalea sp.]|nr:hypothetical protein [Galbitalea sp.]
MSLKISRTRTRTRLGRFPRLIGIVAAAGIGLGLALIGALPANAAVTDRSVVATITVGSQPSGVASTPDGTHAYVVNNGTAVVGSRGNSGAGAGAGGLGQSHHTSTGVTLNVPSVGLDVPLGALNAVDGEITPPGFTSAYWVRNLAVPASGGAARTVFVVMHSLRGGVAPGNYLTNVQTQTSKAIVKVAGIDYTVTGSQLSSSKINLL